MIGYLRGEVLENSDGKLIVAVGASGGPGVGYSVAVPQSAAYSLIAAGRNIELFIHTHVREDALDLYGFATRMEKDLFLTLLTVNGIGPKGAIGILSRVEPTQLIDAILNEDKESLVQIPGVGKKTAERVVLELADPLRKKMEAGTFNIARPASAAKSSASGAAPENFVLRDAREALVGLGYREQDVTPVLRRVLEEMPAPKVEELIRTALQQMR
jgi:Holliday junction DNA helicase RuvA